MLAVERHRYRLEAPQPILAGRAVWAVRADAGRFVCWQRVITPGGEVGARQARRAWGYRLLAHPCSSCRV